MMSPIALTTLVFFTFSAMSMGLEKPGKAPLPGFMELDLVKDLPELKKTKIAGMQGAVRDKGCDTNLCFVIQGGNGVSNKQYQNQKDFVDIVINIVTTDNPANLAAAQYHTGITPIFQLTKNKPAFLRALKKSKRVRGKANIAEAMFYCTKVARPQEEDANKMILLGNGFSTIGKGQFQAAQRFRDNSGAVCAVAVGKANKKGLRKLTGNKNHIVRIDQFFELAEIIVDVVEEICNLKGN